MQELVGKRVKAVYRDDPRTKVVRGVLEALDDLTLTIRSSDEGNLIIIGKAALISCIEDTST